MVSIAEVRDNYIAFFKKRGHAIIPSASLIPENDPTTLFTGSGMQPLLPYLLGQAHPAGKRLANSQKCFRSEDIAEVGDNRHTTFFEMLGNWSLGDSSTGVRTGYWKEEQLAWLWEFLTGEIRIPKEKLWVTCFEGDAKWGLPRDDEAAKIWEGVGVPKEKILFYRAEKNWWSRAGVPEKMPEGEPGGPDSEVFYEFTQVEHNPRFGKDCHPNCDCGRFMEIGNSVFMEYRKIDGGFEKLAQKNIDFGGGLERITAAANDEPDMFQLDVFKTAINNLEAYTEGKYEDEENKKSYRIVLDHIRAAVFLMADGVMPSNVDKGYFVRRLLRRAILHLDRLKMDGNQLHNPLDSIVAAYKAAYPNLLQRKSEIENALNREEQQFRKTLERGLKEFNWRARTYAESAPEKNELPASVAFELFATYGFPLELIVEEARERGLTVDEQQFQNRMEAHRIKSGAGAEKKFKGGLADTSEMSLKYHTATHLLHQALRDVLGPEVRQKGSNITPERLRFDFAFSRKMTDEEKAEVEKTVNEKIRADLPVRKRTLPLAEAKKSGALHFFDEKYPDEVLVHYIGDSLDGAYSKEFCGGPHVAHTGELGTFRIVKEEAVSAGVRRIKAVLE